MMPSADVDMPASYRVRSPEGLAATADHSGSSKTLCQQDSTVKQRYKQQNLLKQSMSEGRCPSSV